MVPRRTRSSIASLNNARLLHSCVQICCLCLPRSPASVTNFIIMGVTKPFLIRTYVFLHSIDQNDHWGVRCHNRVLYSHYNKRVNSWPRSIKSDPQVTLVNSFQWINSLTFFVNMRPIFSEILLHVFLGYKFRQRFIAGFHVRFMKRISARDVTSDDVINTQRNSSVVYEQCFSSEILEFVRIFSVEMNHPKVAT